MSLNSCENSFVLTDLWKGSQGPSAVPGLQIENHCPRAALHMCLRRHVQGLIHSPKHLPCARHCSRLDNVWTDKIRQSSLTVWAYTGIGRMFTPELFIIAQKWKQSKSPWTGEPINCSIVMKWNTIQQWKQIQLHAETWMGISKTAVRKKSQNTYSINTTYTTAQKQVSLNNILGIHM